jgi:hypothetical protein
MDRPSTWLTESWGTHAISLFHLANRLRIAYGFGSVRAEFATPSLPIYGMLHLW